MKVACIGNMNNMLFSLTRYLREYGVEAYLLLPANELNGLEHFFPENDHFDYSFKDYTIELSWGSGGSEVYRKASATKIKNDTREYDFFIVCGVSIGYLEKAGIRADIFFPHGSDIKYSSQLASKFSIINKLRNPHGYEFFKNVKRGIQNAQLINIEFSDPFWKEPLIALNVLDKAKYIGCPMLFDKIYNREAIKENYQHGSEFNYYSELRKQNDLIVVNQATQTWVTPIDQKGRPSKGSDNLITGFAEFIRNKPDSYQALLILFEYGSDVEASKKLIHDLGIADQVIWHPKTSRKNIMCLLSMADFACGEFEPGCIGGNTTWEALVSGACLLHYLNTQYTKFEGFLDSPYPFVNVKEPSAIAHVLLDFVSNPQKYKQIGEAGTLWYKKYFAGKSVQAHLDLIKMKEIAMKNE